MSQSGSKLTPAQEKRAAASTARSNNHGTPSLYQPEEELRSKAPRIVLGKVTDYKVEKVDFIWHGRIARGELVVVAGRGNATKSTLMADVIARLTRGETLPGDSKTISTPGGVIVFPAEDSIEHTLIPRLIAADANFNFVRFDKGIGRDGESGLRERLDLSRLDHLDALHNMVDETRETIGSCEMLLFDPITSYIGNTDSGDNAQVRRVLDRLTTFAHEKKVAVVMISHCRKGGEQSQYGSDMVIGAKAWIDVPRLALMVHADPRDQERRYVLSVKHNICKKAPTVAYKVVTVHGTSDGIDWETGKVDWLPGEFDVGEEILAMRPVPGDALKKQAAIAQWIREQLANGHVLAADLEAAAAKAGYHDFKVVAAIAKGIGCIRGPQPGVKNGRSGFRLPEHLLPTAPTADDSGEPVSLGEMDDSDDFDESHDFPDPDELAEVMNDERRQTIAGN